MNKELILEDILNKLGDVEYAVSDADELGFDLSVARDMIDELREELIFRLE